MQLEKPPRVPCAYRDEVVLSIIEAYMKRKNTVISTKLGKRSGCGVVDGDGDGDATRVT